MCKIFKSENIVSKCSYVSCLCIVKSQEDGHHYICSNFILAQLFDWSTFFLPFQYFFATEGSL